MMIKNYHQSGCYRLKLFHIKKILLLLLLLIKKKDGIFHGLEAMPSVLGMIIYLI